MKCDWELPYSETEKSNFFARRSIAALNQIPALMPD